MGLYENVRAKDGVVVLRELITAREFSCRSTSGYRGNPGELWYVRLLPPLMSEYSNAHIVFTTPYVLIESTANDWVQFIKRTLPMMEGSSDVARLDRLFKYGPTTHFWNDFVFQGYHHHQFDAIFLAGIPDLKDTLPHT